MNAEALTAALCRRFEGLRLKAHKCPAGIWTIGYGATGRDIGPELVWTEEQAEARLMTDVSRALRSALALCPALLREHDGRQAAIADFVFNLGAGRLKGATLRQAINEGDWDAAADELMKWVNGGGRRLAGLVLRRAAECALLPSGA